MTQAIAGRSDAPQQGIEISLEEEVVSAPVGLELVCQMVTHGLSERCCLRVVDLSASALRYGPAKNRNCALNEKFITLAQRHRG